MATWTNVADANLQSGKPARSVDIIAIRDNVTAVTEGATGAPTIVQSALNTTAISLSGSMTTAVNIAMIGYAFFPMIHSPLGVGSVLVGVHTADRADADLPCFLLSNPSGAATTYDVDYRYINA